jgi:hypothetical protein
MGAVILGDKAFDLIPSLETALRDEVPEVRIVAAEALYGLGKAGPALATLEDVLQNKTPETVLMTINILQSLGYKALAALKVDLLKVRETNKNDYVQRAVDYALETVDQTANCSSLRLR